MTERRSFTFSREPQSVAAARAALDELGSRMAASSRHDAVVCVSELVTNAIQHPGMGGEELELTLELRDDTLRVEVSDPGSGFDHIEPTRGDERGWGLFIVDRLATEWGVERTSSTTVWFEIAPPEHAAERAADSAEQFDAGASRGRTGDDERLVRAASLRLRGRLAGP